MPFAPIPAEFQTLLTRLKTLPTARILDLGCGQGEFAPIFKAHDLPFWGVDRLPSSAGVEAAIRADALQPPFLRESCDCIVAGNLVHHLLAQDRCGGFLNIWLGLLKPGGSLFIFEDEPTAENNAAGNYSLLQAFLARVMTQSRGPLLGQVEFKTLVNKNCANLKWVFGTAQNSIRPNSEKVLQMLRGQGPDPDPASEAGKLSHSIRKNGLSYGNFWWAHVHAGEPEKESQL